MTLKDIEAMEAETLSPSQVGSIIGFNPQSIRIQAHENPELLGFPVICTKTRVRIPKQAFLAFMRGKQINKPANGKPQEHESQRVG